MTLHRIPPGGDFQSLRFGPGDRIELELGATYPCSGWWTSKASQAHGLTIAAAGPGPRPRIVSQFADVDAPMATLHVAHTRGVTLEGLHFVRQHPTRDIGRAALEIREGADDCTVRNCVIEGGSDGLRAINRVRRLVVEDCEVYGAWVDAMWLQVGDGTVIRRNTIRGYSLGTPDGDGIQLSECTGTVTTEFNTITMPRVSVKQGIFACDATTSALHKIIGNTVHNPGSSTAAHIAILGQGEIRRNVCTGRMGRGLQISSMKPGDWQSTIEGNVLLADTVQHPSQFGIVIDGGHLKRVTIKHNALHGPWERGVYITSQALPEGSVLDADRNHIDCMGRAGARPVVNDAQRAKEPA